MQAKIQDLQANFDRILELVGSESYVNWQAFTKSTSELSKNVDQLINILTAFKEIQQKRFIDSMKRMKANDIPDLIKTVKSKKLPREALKSILSKFTVQDNKVNLKCTAESLKAQSSTLFNEYVSMNKELSVSIVKTHELVLEKIKSSGVYQEPEPAKELVSTFKHTFNEERISEICKTISVQASPQRNDLINIQTYGQIVDSTFEVVKDQYIRLTLDARKKQRKLMGNATAYANAIVEYLTNTEVLILEGQRAIVKKLGLSKEKVEESEVFMMERGLAQTILLIQSGLRTKVKESIQSEKPVDFQKTKEIMKYQIAMVKEKTPFFKIMLSSLEKSAENFQILPLIIALTLNDFVFDKFGLEEQDFMKSISDSVVLSHPELSAIFKQMEKVILVLMRESGVISEDMAKVMELQSQNIQNQMSEMGFTGNPGGIFPGSSPNDLLQFQQKNQFQQMKKK